MTSGNTATKASRKREEEEEDNSKNHDEGNTEADRREAGRRRRLHDSNEPTTSATVKTATCARATSHFTSTAAAEEKKEDEEEGEEVEDEEEEDVEEECFDDYSRRHGRFGCCGFRCCATATSRFATTLDAKEEEKVAEKDKDDEEEEDDEEWEDEEWEDEEEEDEEEEHGPDNKWKRDVLANVRNLAKDVHRLRVSIDGSDVCESLVSHEEKMNDVVLIAETMERNNRTMETLSLTYMNLDQRAVLAIARGIRHQPNLKFVHLGNVYISPDFLSSSPEDLAPDHWKVFSESIARAKSLDHLSIMNMCQWINWSVIVSDILVNSTSIDCLTLWAKPFDDYFDHAMNTLLETLPNSASLTQLWLFKFEIHCAHVPRLVESLQDVVKLQRVHLDDNEIGPEGLRLLMRAMARHSTWHQLSLSENKAIGFEGLTVAGEELQRMMQYWQEQNNATRSNNNIIKWIQLDLSYCCANGEMEENEERKLQQIMARGRAEQALLNGVKDNCYINKLELYGNHLTGDALDTRPTE